MIARLLSALFGRGDWMETYTGAKYYPCSPLARDIRIADIAHHLSMICRFTGAVRRFYSVAEHSVHVSYCVPPEMALQGLLHDAEEAYVTDQGRPVKHSFLMLGYRIIARRNWLVIAQKFGLPRDLDREVHYADNSVLLAERAALMYPTNRPWSIPAEAAEITIHGWSPDDAEQAFLDRYYELTRGQPQRVQPSAPAAGSPSCNFGMTGGTA